MSEISDLLARYAAVSATSPEGVAIAKRLDEIKRDLLGEAAARRVEKASPRRQWRGRVPEKSERSWWRGRRDVRAAAVEPRREERPSAPADLFAGQDSAPFEDMR